MSRPRQTPSRLSVSRSFAVELFVVPAAVQDMKGAPTASSLVYPVICSNAEFTYWISPVFGSVMTTPSAVDSTALASRARSFSAFFSSVMSRATAKTPSTCPASSRYTDALYSTGVDAAVARRISRAKSLTEPSRKTCW